MTGSVKYQSLPAKSFSFQSTTRAEYVYNQAVQILNAYSLQGTKLVKREGNVVTVPKWFPFSPN